MTANRPRLPIGGRWTLGGHPNLQRSIFHSSSSNDAFPPGQAFRHPSMLPCSSIEVIAITKQTVFSEALRSLLLCALGLSVSRALTGLFCVVRGVSGSAFLLAVTFGTLFVYARDTFWSFCPCTPGERSECFILPRILMFMRAACCLRSGLQGQNSGFGRRLDV